MINSRLEQIGAACGIVFVALQMASQALIQVGGGEPPFNAPAETIAERLVLSPKTVRNYITEIFSKLQVADRAQVIIRARSAGLG